MDFKKALPHIAAVVIFLLVACVTFSPQFSGKGLRQGDIQSYRAASKEMKDYAEATGERANWTGTSFSGMPTYLISTVSAGNNLKYLGKPFRAFIGGGAGIFFAGMLCCYLLLVLNGVNPWLSIAGGVGVGLATTTLVVYGAGHTTKVQTIFYLPLVAGGVIMAFRKYYLLGGLLFALGMGMAIMSNHPQMLYYFGLTLPVYGIAQLVKAVRAGELVSFGKSLGVLVVGLVLAIGAGASNLMTTLEYSPATMRGGQVLETPLVDSSTPSGDVPEDGLAWDYATMWSNNTKDIIATYAPLAAGGGGGQAFNDRAFSAAMRSAGFQAPPANRVPAYHGGKIEGTAGPEYLGAVIWALFIFGLFTARRSLAIWLGLGTLLVMGLSMGKYLDGFNHFLYDTLPYLNKLRAPSSALNILPFMMVGLGVFGIDRWLRTREDTPETARKQLLYSGIAAAVFGLMVLFVFPSVLGFSSPTDASMFAGVEQQKPGALRNILAGLEESRRSLYMADAWRSFLFVGLTFGVLFLLFRKTVSPLIAGLALTALVAFDFSGINGRYISDKNWVTVNKRTKEVPMTAADKQILADPDIHYRVFNLTTSFHQDPMTSYYHKHIGGYSAVKMRRYQDIITKYLISRDPDVINMLNTKYIIVPGQGGAPQAQQNPAAYGAAWLVNDIMPVSSNDAEFNALGTVENLKGTAIVHSDFSDEVAGLQPTGEGSIEITNYSPNELTYSFNSPSEQLVVFSEVWYGPDLGWEATIDGSPAELIRTNYILRGLRVPAGQHTITMTFHPASYFTGKTISMICSLLIILGLIGYAGWRFMENRKAATAA
ncbi:YfhO family protein [Neolewinella aurantiaca]|uniref:YfhO family protein n=1 Tax=Neolewinella aurantiaca TaxID=2602767 RepID=A0A5C7FSX3_9BACT|nr:YfhO family protein [Neolewinella aurantiaca]TXF87824.1 YfhO family protein [Neolewinella aurantiaca]